MKRRVYTEAIVCPRYRLRHRMKDVARRAFRACLLSSLGCATSTSQVDCSNHCIRRGWTIIRVYIRDPILVNEFLVAAQFALCIYRQELKDIFGSSAFEVAHLPETDATN